MHTHSICSALTGRPPLEFCKLARSAAAKLKTCVYSHLGFYSHFDDIPVQKLRYIIQENTAPGSCT